jgi:hypothetical protein
MYRVYEMLGRVLRWVYNWWITARLYTQRA